MIVHGRHCIEANVAILGCAYAKLVVALLPHMFSAEQIRSTIEAAGAKAIVGLGEPAETERVRSAADEPPIEVDMPPPNRSDMPPPRPLCNSTNIARTTLVRIRTMDKVRIGQVNMGTTITG